MPLPKFMWIYKDKNKKENELIKEWINRGKERREEGKEGMKLEILKLVENNYNIMR